MILKSTFLLTLLRFCGFLELFWCSVLKISIYFVECLLGGRNFNAMKDVMMQHPSTSPIYEDEDDESDNVEDGRDIERHVS